jgi:DNA topoisomerase-1
VIVESPAKAKTISKFLGRKYSVKASMGHVRDLPRSQFGVDVENGFTPKYITVRGQGKVLQELRTGARKADRVLLATDPDREGEAISWHLAEALKLDPEEPRRIEFHEITKQAILKAVKSPRPINTNLVDAQQARRVLDRLVGYKLSPFLWAKVKPGLSAGRVQSAALRMICDREQEVRAFVKEEYWTITLWAAKTAKSKQFPARLVRLGDAQCDLKNETEADAVCNALADAGYRVTKVTKSERVRKTPPPFTTSTLQQEAARRLGFTARRTMSVAQQLYEGLDVGKDGVVGLITYLRTDAVRVSSEAQSEAQQYIDQTWGTNFRPAKPPQYKTRQGAQEAHEAIRPTSVGRTPDTVKPHLTRDQHLLYKLIWERFLASQMAPAVYDTVAADIIAVDQNGAALPYTFRATGSVIKFPGYMALYSERTDDDTQSNEASQKQLPELVEGDALIKRSLEPKQHFTQPPPRYTEAMLVKAMEELGIGRPSTYAAIIDTIRRRGYVTTEERRFVPTELGMLTVDILKNHFPDIVDVEFTANMEKQLDAVEEGAQNWVQLVSEFYKPFSAALEQAHHEVEEVKVEDEVTDEVCELCGRNMVIKWGRFGKFLACPGFPDCKNTKPILVEIGVPCPACSTGSIVERKSRRGRVFYGCNRYPDCDFTSWDRPVTARCPACGGYMVEKRKRGSDPVWACADSNECGFLGKPPEEGQTEITPLPKAAAKTKSAAGKTARSSAQEATKA